MSDDELLDKVAVYWIELGGDAEGIVWCWQQLAAKVRKLERTIKEQP